MFIRTFVSLALLAAAAAGELVRIEFHDRTDVLEGRAFGKSGPYERLVGRAYFEVDPALEANRIITDIRLGPRNARGRVEFSADLYVLKPRDPRLGNGTILFEVSNRGNKYLLRQFNFGVSSNDPQEPKHFGDCWLLEQGYWLAWLGWQFDVPEQPNLLRLFTPVARGDAVPITGWVRSEYVPDKRVTSFSLADRTMIAYPAAFPDDPEAQLTVRDRVEAPRRVIARNQWQFAREESGRIVPDPTHIYMAASFEPGKIYEVVYRAQNPPLAGLGPAAVRDLISFLKYGGTPEWVKLSDQSRHLKRAIGVGTSQSGRFLRTFLYYGFNQDEKGRQVFDGIIAHVAGAGRGSFNHRFAQPSRDGHPFMNQFYPTDIFPFSDLEQTDPETGLTEGLLTRAMKAGVVPKIFYTNSSYEYYGRAASLIHTTLDGRRDAPLAAVTRIYLFAGTQHSPAALPQRTGTQNLVNPNDYRWPMRALLAAMQRWVADGVEPPPSHYPRIAEGELVPLASLRFPKIPGVALPVRLRKAWRVDYGPEFLSAGIIALEPPKIGEEFPVLVPQVDQDGNEIAGIRLPEIAVPLGTYTGWNLRARELGAPDELYSMAGSFLPFARTRAERQKAQDPRRSIEERYAGRAEYLEKLTAATRRLAQQGYLLESDVNAIVQECARRWDHLMR